nr:TolC family outer membrane protein [Roseibium sp. RKSG952]
MMRSGFAKLLTATALSAAGVGGSVVSASGESIQEALARAYSNNPTLNAARATLRVVDENVPQALAGWRPTVSASGTIGREVIDAGSSSSSSGSLNQATGSVTVSQTVFQGFQTINSTRQAESLVFAQRELLRETEQEILLDAAEAYVTVIEDTALVALQRSDVKFLEEQVRAAKDRFEVGEGTRTDVSQAEARLAESQATLASAIATLNSARATYVQIIGVEPKNLSARTNIDRLVPKSLEEALKIFEEFEPSIRAARYEMDAALFNVKATEGQLLPTVTLDGSLSRSVNPSASIVGYNTAEIVGSVSIPIYQAGTVSSEVRQAKEELGQAEIQLDEALAQIRADVVSAWGNYQASEQAIVAARAAVAAQQLALEGVIEEQRVGQRTTLDVLDAQRELISQQSDLVTAQADRITYGYTLVSEVGKLDAATLDLPAKRYNPEQHYRAVRGKWFGLRTPDGR